MFSITNQTHSSLLPPTAARRAHSERSGIRECQGEMWYHFSASVNWDYNNSVYEQDYHATVFLQF